MNKNSYSKQPRQIVVYKSGKDSMMLPALLEEINFKPKKVYVTRKRIRRFWGLSDYAIESIILED